MSIYFDFLTMSTLLKKAIKFCEENKHRLSKPRLEILNIINTSKKPIKAYEILTKLTENSQTQNHLQLTGQ